MKRKCRSRANVAEGRRILLAVGSTGMTAHDFLYGFSRYYRTKSDWHLDLDFARDIPVPGRRTSGNDVYDGIVSDATVLDAKLLSRSGPDTRIVLFGDLRADLDGRKMAYVQTDDTAIGRLGAQSLLSLGNFMSFGYVPVANESKWSARRGRGFAEALSEAGRSCVSFRGKDEAEIDSYLRGLPKPTAVLCACDAVARAVVERCKSCRIRVPEEVSVLGVDNDESICELESPSISSILPDHDAAGYTAAQTLDALFRRCPRSRPIVRICSKMRVVTRESTRPIPPVSKLILRARSVIAKKATAGIGVGDVAKELGVSRALLDLRFRQFARSSVRAEIEAARLEAVRRKLLSTALPIKTIAASCGYKGAAHLGAIFRRRFGITMSECRAKR